MVISTSKIALQLDEDANCNVSIFSLSLTATASDRLQEGKTTKDKWPMRNVRVKEVGIGSNSLFFPKKTAKNSQKILGVG